jgi:polyisoprenyl-phosphate glycosyltransferase
MAKHEDSIPIVLSLVIPVYCEEEQIVTVLNQADRILRELSLTYELIVVDDGSTDSTFMRLEESATQLLNLRVFRLSRNFGKEAAICAGLQMARGKAVIVMDADLQHPPQLIPEMVRLWAEAKFDVVEAIKTSRGKESLLNRAGAKAFYRVLKYLSGYSLEGYSDFKLVDRKVLGVWLQMGERNLFFRGMIAWLGFRHVQLPFVVPDRLGGRSRWSVFSLIKLSLTAITAFSSLPLQLVTISGFIFLGFSVVLGIQSLWLKLTGNAVEGFTTVILLLLIIGSIIMISLGIIGVYIARIYDEVKRRPRYAITEMLDRTSTHASSRWMDNSPVETELTEQPPESQQKLSKL